MKSIICTLSIVASMVCCQLAFADNFAGWNHGTATSSTYGTVDYYAKSNGLTTNFYMAIPDGQIPPNSLLGQYNVPGTSYTLTTPFGGEFLLEF